MVLSIELIIDSYDLMHMGSHRLSVDFVRKEWNQLDNMIIDWSAILRIAEKRSKMLLQTKIYLANSHMKRMKHMQNSKGGRLLELIFIFVEREV